MINFLGAKGHVSCSTAQGGGSVAFSNSNSVNFDGTNDRGVISAAAALNMQSYSTWTVSVWFKTTTSSASSFFGCWEYGATQRQWLIYMLSSGNIRFFSSANGSTSSEITTPLAYNDGAWHNITCVYTGNSVDSYIYIDGSEVVSGVLSSLLNVTNPLVAGCTADGAPTEFLNGSLDEISLWTTDLSASEVSEIYNSGSPADLDSHSKAANLLGWWRMGDGDTFPTIQDNKNSNDMTLTNMDSGDITTDVP